MKSRNQLIQSILSLKVRQQVQHYMEPGIIQNVLTDEFNKAFANIMNRALKEEASKALQREVYERKENSIQRNGYKNTSIPGIAGSLVVKRPVIRKGTLQLPLLDALKRIGKGLVATLASAFWMKGTSTRNTAAILNETLGAKMSPSDISNITNALEPGLREWENRPISDDILYIFLDALYLPVHWRSTEALAKGFTAKQALLCGLGIDSAGITHYLGHLLGDRENQESWNAFLDNLLKRGLNPAHIHLAISDEHKAIIAAVQNKLGIPHQYCVFHKMQNVRTRIPGQDRKAFLEDFSTVFWAESRDKAVQATGFLQAKWSDRYPRIVELTLRNLENYLMFMNEPKERWKSLRTSNRIERFNAELRRRLRPAGTIHSELELTKIIWSVSNAQEKTWNSIRPFRLSKKEEMNKVA